MGLGMRPSLTGRGNGTDFVQACVNRCLSELAPGQKLFLSVASFNRRAIRVYQRLGFHTVREYKSESGGKTHDFIEMVLN